MPKYIPTKEELEFILETYSETKKYTKVAEATGLSTQIVTRIIKENQKVQVATPNEKYCGPEPFFPTKEEYLQFWNPSQEWKESYERI